MTEDPLLTQMIACPVCEKQVPLQVANPRMYTVASRESDRHVTAYRWLHDLETRVVPHRYKVWQCPSCLFADFAERVDKNRPEHSHDLIRRTFRDISIEKHMVLDSLRELVSPGELDSKGAISIHLAAVLIAGLSSIGHAVDYGKLGQLALRLGWLYRELGDGTETAAPEGSQVLKTLAEATERFDKLLLDAEDTLREIRGSGERRGLELQASSPYPALIDMLEVRLKALEAESATLQMTVLKDMEGRVAPVSQEAGVPEGALERVLGQLVPLWPEVPRNERQSLTLALEALEYSYQYESSGESLEQGVAQGNLILDLLIRLGELDRALEWTSRISKYAFETTTDLRNRLSAARETQTLSGFDATAIGRKIAALGLSQQQAGERRRDILALLLERDREVIDGILTQTAQLPAQERAKALADAGIQDGVVGLLSRELAAPSREAEGGWFKRRFQTAPKP